MGDAQEGRQRFDNRYGSARSFWKRQYKRTAPNHSAPLRYNALVCHSAFYSICLPKQHLSAVWRRSVGFRSTPAPTGLMQSFNMKWLTHRTSHGVTRQTTRLVYSRGGKNDRFFDASRFCRTILSRCR
jgi:hypothetical protein